MFINIFPCTQVTLVCFLAIFSTSTEAGQSVRRRTRQSGGGYNSNNSINSINGGGGGGGYQTESNSYSPSPYKFEYGVYDPNYGTDFGHSEERNAQDETFGQYRVRLPDGRLQIVTYTAGKNGYKADVVYQDAQSTSPSGNSGSGGYGAPSAPSSSYGVGSSSGGGGGGFSSSRGGRNFVNIMRQINGRSFSHNY